MKTLTTFILSLVVLMAGFQNSLMWLDYETNRDFYEMQCVNQDKPEMECHGKCKVQDEAEKSGNASNLVKVSFEFNLYQPKHITLPIFKVVQKKIAEKTILKDNTTLLSGHIKILPHPPQV